MNLKTIKLLGTFSIASLFAAGSALAQSADNNEIVLTPHSSGGGFVAFVIWLLLVVLWVASGWKIYTKAGQPGWAVIIPIFNLYILLKIVGRPWWWLLLLFIPLVNLIIGIIVVLDLAKSFGKGVGFALGIIFLPFIFYPILGFGDARYSGPVARI